MGDEMICCPFCGQELEQEQGSDGWFCCVNAKCCYNHTTSHKTIWQALIQSQRDLEYANEEIETLKQKLEYEKEQNKCWEHNYSVVKEQHERGYEYAIKTIKQLESDLQIARQALEEIRDETGEDRAGFSYVVLAINMKETAENALAQITHDNKE